MSAPNPAATFVEPTLAGKFRMGPLMTESPGLDFWWNDQGDDGTYSACEEPSGWESLEYITPVDQVGGRDGGLLGPQSVAPRKLEVEGLLVAPSASALRQNLARLRRILGPQGLPGPRQPVVWEQHDFGSGQRLAVITRPVGTFRVRTAGGFQEGGVAAAVSFTLLAANPPWKFRAGLPQSAEAGLLNPALIQGRTYSRSYSYAYGSATNIGGELICLNTGDLAAYPTFTVTGPVDFPVITNATTGAEFSVNRNLLTGEVVTVDSRTGAVTPGSVRLVGRAFPLAPGVNTVRWRSSSGAYDPAARLRLEWRSTSS